MRRYRPEQNGLQLSSALMNASSVAGVFPGDVGVAPIIQNMSVGQFDGYILTAARAVLQRMHLDGDLVARLYGVRFPACFGDLADGGHLERPVSRFPGGVRGDET